MKEPRRTSPTRHERSESLRGSESNASDSKGSVSHGPVSQGPVSPGPVSNGPVSRGPKQGPLRITVPTRNDRFLSRLTEVIGGPLGRFTDPGRVNPGIFTVQRVLVILTVIGILGAILAKNMCRTQGWGGLNSYQWACYSDWSALFHARGFADNAFAPFTGGELFEYPVLMSVVASVTAWLTPGGDAFGGQFNRTLAYFDINLFFVALLWILTVIVTSKTAGRRPWDAAMIAVAPGMMLATTINWDMWAVAALAVALLFWSRDKPFVAGIFIGLGTATKLYPILFLGAVIVLAIRTGKYKPLIWNVAGTAVAWIAVNIPFALADFDAWSYFFEFSRDRDAGYSSIWYAWNLGAANVPGMPLMSAEFINKAGFWGFALACVLIAVLALVAKQRPRLSSILFLIVASFVLFNKVYSPQFVVWLVPLVALAWPRWRDFLIWQLFEVLHFWAVWLHLWALFAQWEPQHSFPPAFYVYAVIAHILATVWIMGKVVMSILDPSTDPVRRVGQEDPQAGPFAGQPDKFSWAILSRYLTGPKASSRERENTTSS